MKGLKELTLVAFDVETTSLFDAAGAIVELGAVRFDGEGEVLGQYQQLVDPRCAIPAEARAVHGITDAEVRGKPTIAEVLPGFMEFLSDGSVPLAHNASFDVGFLSTAMTRSCIPIPDLPVVDSIPIVRILSPQAKNFKLETLARELGIAEREEHRALADSLLLKDVFLEFIRRSKESFSLLDLLAMRQPLRFADAGVYTIDPPVGFEKLGGAIEDQEVIEMVYDGGSQGQSPRLVTPLTLYQKNGWSYLVAVCHIDQSEKSFRLDRIGEFRLAGNND